MMRIFKRYSDNRTKDEVLLDDAFGLVWCTRQGRAVEANKVKKGVDFDELLIKAFIMLLFCVPAAVIHGAVGFVVSFAGCCYALSASKYVKEHSQ